MKHYTLWPLLLLCCSSLLAQNAFQRAADQLAGHPSLKHGAISLCVIDIESGRTLASINEQMSLRPASNLKLLTTGTALALLGPDYRFDTHLSYTGSISDQGRLLGNLVLYGTGDPSLGSPYLAGVESPDAVLSNFRLAVQRAGIRAIEGQIVADASRFGSRANCRSWQWEDLGNYYAAGTWSLNWHENLYLLHFQQRAQGKPPRVQGTVPPVSGMELINELQSGPPGSGDQAYIYGGPYQMQRYLRGSIPAGSGRFTIKGSIPNPPLLLARALRQELNAIAIPSRAARAAFAEAQGGQLLYSYRSPGLSRIVERCNQESVNLYAEAMLRAIGYEKQQSGSTAAGLAVLQSYWEGRGLPFAGIHLEDGSGLSGDNAVSAYFMAAFMRKMAVGPQDVAEAFRLSIPLAGRTGSMEYRLRGTRAEGRLRAKTGTLRNVRAFTGYANSRSGKRLAYSVIVNNYSGSGGQMRQQIEQFLLALCEN